MRYTYDRCGNVVTDAGLGFVGQLPPPPPSFVPRYRRPPPPPSIFQRREKRAVRRVIPRLKFSERNLTGTSCARSSKGTLRWMCWVTGPGVTGGEWHGSGYECFCT